MATYLQINNYSTLDADDPPGGCVWYYTQLRDVGISVTEGVAGFSAEIGLCFTRRYVKKKMCKTKQKKNFVTQRDSELQNISVSLVSDSRNEGKLSSRCFHSPCKRSKVHSLRLHQAEAAVLV